MNTQRLSFKKDDSLLQMKGRNRMAEEAISCHCPEIEKIEDELETLKESAEKLDVDRIMIEQINTKLTTISNDVPETYICDDIASVQGAVRILAEAYDGACDSMRQAIIKKQVILQVKLGALKVADALFHLMEKEEKEQGLES